MLPAYLRLKKTKDIERVFERGRGFRGGGLLLKAIKNGRDTSRFAFVAGRKFSKKAVQRNKAKRLIREAVRKNLSNIAPGFDVVVSVARGAGAGELKNAETTIKKLIQKTILKR